MSEPGEPQPQAVAVELLTLRLGPDGVLAALNQWNAIERDWGGKGHMTAFIGLLDLNILLLNTLAGANGVPEDGRATFAAEYLRQHALNQSQRDSRPDNTD
ncbi:hypothetical protein ACGFSG_39405 [Streptomyces sp. NPDC048512]|uniref:hypothetical protein n=1 Tax=Streptomyces sp. NPDC048512 TaxID=3365563 RepID=UPI0037229CDF